jgi:RNA polymerase sigma factor (sigma-70 family)
VNNFALSQNLVQDTFLKTWKYIVLGGKIEIMKPFLYRVLNCLIIDEYRKRKTISLDTMVENGFDPTGDSSENIYNILDSKNAVLMIASLPKKYREIMSMKYALDLSLSEMAKRVHRPKSTLSVQLSRGLCMLKKIHSVNN